MRNRERIQPAVAHNVGDAGTTWSPAISAPTIWRCQREAHEDGRGADERRHVRRTPIERRCSEGNDRDGETSAAHTGSAIESLCFRGSDSRADVLTSGDKSDAGSES